MAGGTPFTSYSVDNDRKFRDTLARAGAKVRDLRIPLTLISKDFYRSQRAIWQLSGPGQYPDLADSTKASKARAGVPLYPILERTGALKEAASDPTGRGAINRLDGMDTLHLEVDEGVVPYAIFHQVGAGRVPMRKYFFIGPEAPRFASSEQAGRLSRWTKILNAYILEVLEPVGEESA